MMQGAWTSSVDARQNEVVDSVSPVDLRFVQLETAGNISCFSAIT